MSVGASIVVAGVGVGVRRSGCVSRAGGVERSGIDESKKIQERKRRWASTHRVTVGRYPIGI